MTGENSCLVDYQMVPVGFYIDPVSKKCQWAEADVTQAAEYMKRLIDDRVYSRRIGEKAKASIRGQFSAEKAGIEISKRIGEQ